MASRYWQTPADPSKLEIRGWSRGSIVDNPRIKFLEPNSSLELPAFSESLLRCRNTPDPESDDDSTIKDGSSGEDYSPAKALPGEDAITVSELSQYWSGANSSTTGNTTERSSLYSWGDDVMDHKTTRKVQEMFHGIEKLLFESVLSGSSLLQHECREWMDAFPHLRILGKQCAPIRDEGFQSLPSSHDTSGVVTPILAPQSMDNDAFSLVLSGTSVTPLPVPEHYSRIYDNNSGSENQTDTSYLHEEIFEQDGDVEEYLAYDIREMDEEETAKRYHVPRRRRLGYPPITPNACVRDAVINQLFDGAWVKIISVLDKVKMENRSTKKSTKSLWKVLLESYRSEVKEKSTANDAYLYRDMTTEPYDSYALEFIEDRNLISNPSFQFAQPDHFHFPPSSRGGFADPGLGGGRPSGRLSNTNFAALDGVMKISQKKLQARNDKPNGTTPQDSSMDLALPVPHIESSTLYPRGSTSRSQLHGSMSPQVRSQFSLHGVANRQPSAKLKGRSSRPARLQPLGDRAKTPTLFDGTVTAKKLAISSFGPPNLDEHSEIIGIRVTSPTDPPPTAPAIPGGSLYSRHPLPPLQSLHENTSIEFTKKARGRVGRISSAIAEETLNKQTMRGWEGASRPNTTQAFRNDGLFRQRASPITPSNFSSRALGARGSLQAIKSSSPTGLGPIMGGSLFYPHNFGHTSDNHIPGLAGIHGISMLGHPGTSQSPHEQDEDSRVWGNPLRRRQLLGN